MKHVYHFFSMQKTLMAQCRSNVDFVIAVSDLLQQETGLSHGPPYPEEVQATVDRWEKLETLIYDLKPLQEAQKRWQQFLRDLESVETWLGNAESHWAKHSTVPTELQELGIQLLIHNVSSVIRDVHSDV